MTARHQAFRGNSRVFFRQGEYPLCSVRVCLCVRQSTAARVCICVCNLLRSANGFLHVLTRVTPLPSFCALLCWGIKAAAARNHPIVWEHWGPLSILSGTSKHTARRRTIRVHGWDENALQYVLWSEIHEDGFITKSRVLLLRLLGGLPLI